ncbi:MAG: ROK family protein [bacterium]
MGDKAGAQGLHTLSIDIGGSHLKASVLDSTGAMLVDEVRVDTPKPCPPAVMLKALARMLEPIRNYDRISIGFPGVISDGCVVTAPHFGNRVWRGYPLAQALAERFGKPARLLNDAEVQGYGVITGRGVELVLTLGTGAGSALFRDGILMPHMELSQHPLHGKKTYDDYLGAKALKKKGKRKWNRRVQRAIMILHRLLNYDVLYIGGGNSEVLKSLPDGVFVVDNTAGITGGVRLWNAVARNATARDHGPKAVDSR